MLGLCEAPSTPYIQNMTSIYFSELIKEIERDILQKRKSVTYFRSALKRKVMFFFLLKKILLLLQ